MNRAGFSAYGVEDRPLLSRSIWEPSNTSVVSAFSQDYALTTTQSATGTGAILRFYLNGVFAFLYATNGAFYTSVNEGRRFVAGSLGASAWAAVAAGNTAAVLFSNTASCTRFTTGPSPTVFSITSPAVPANTYRAVAHNGTTFCAVSQGTTQSIASTDEGVTWVTTGVLPISQTWAHCVAGNGTFLAMSSTAAATVCATSTDGLNWTQQAHPAHATGWNYVIWDGSRFIAMGGGVVTFMSSPDGVTWTAQPTWVYPWTTTYSPTSFLWANGQYIMACGSSATNSILVTSRDLINWQLRKLPPMTGPCLVAGGGNLCYSSTVSTLSLLGRADMSAREYYFG